MTGWLIGVPLVLAWLALVFTLADRPSMRQRLARDAEQVWLFPEDQERQPPP